MPLSDPENRWHSDIPAATMGQAGLSILGVDPPTPSWGKMVSDYLPYIRSNWYLSTVPAILIALTMYAFTLMGDRLQDALTSQAQRYTRDGDRERV